MIKKILVLLAVFSIGLTAGSCGGMMGEKKNESQGTDGLRREFQKSKDEFKTKYEGKETKVWGKAQMIENMGSYTVLMFDETDSTLSGVPSVRCEVDKADTDKFAQMKVEKGSMVTVAGTLKTDTAANYLVLKPCKLVAYGVN